MKISGGYQMNAARTDIFERLVDPDAIGGCLPGVEKLDKIGDNEYAMAMNIGIGPVKGTYNGKVTLLNINAPDSYQLQVEGSGRPGFVKGLGTVRLEDAGGSTKISYEGDVEVGGPVGAVAQRMLGGVANRIVGQFFDCMQKQIVGS